MEKLRLVLSRIIILTTCVIAALSVIVAIYKLLADNSTDSYMYLSLSAAIVSVTSVVINELSKTVIRRSEYREYLINELGSDNSKESQSEAGTTEIEIDVRNEKKDIIALMLKNNDEITEYFTISKAQAKSSYRFSILSSVIGMIMIAIAIYNTVVIQNTEIAVIGVVSGSITEVIAGVVLWIHNKSAMQLNHYYDALHENEKFLSAINMADKLSEEKKEQMYIEIIKKQIEISSNRKDEKD